MEQIFNFSLSLARRDIRERRSCYRKNEVRNAKSPGYLVKPKDSRIEWKPKKVPLFSISARSKGCALEIGHHAHSPPIVHRIKRFLSPYFQDIISFFSLGKPNFEKWSVYLGIACIKGGWGGRGGGGVNACQDSLLHFFPTSNHQ